MKKDLAKVEAYAKAMADSNCVRNVYVDKEQDKFFRWLNRQRVDINVLKDCMERSELKARALELSGHGIFEPFIFDQFDAPSPNISPFTSPMFPR